jgi:hypothetical protein
MVAAVTSSRGRRRSALSMSARLTMSGQTVSIG